MGKNMGFFQKIREKIEDMKAKRADTMAVNLGAMYQAIADGSAKTTDPRMSDLEIQNFQANMAKAISEFQKNEQAFNNADKTLQDYFRNKAFQEMKVNGQMEAPLYFKSLGVSFPEIMRMTEGTIQYVRDVNEMAKMTLDKCKEMNIPGYGQDPIGGEIREANMIRNDLIANRQKIQNAMEKRAVELYAQNSKNNAMMAGMNILTPQAQMDANKLQSILLELPEIVTPKMQALYNARKDYETYVQLVNSGADYSAIRAAMHDGLIFPGEPESIVDARLKIFYDEFESSGHSPEPSLYFLAVQMNDFNEVVSSTTIAEMAEKLGLNPNKTLVYDKAEPKKVFDISKARDLMGAESMANFISLFKGGVESGIGDKTMLVKPAEDCAIETAKGQHLWGTTIVFANGLPTGIDLRFSVDEKKQVHLQDFLFHNAPLDKDTLLASKEIRSIIGSLPPAMQQQVYSSYNLNMENGQLRIAVGAVGQEQQIINAREKKIDKLRKDLENGFQVTFGKTEELSSKEQNVEQNKDDHPMTGWEMG